MTDDKVTPPGSPKNLGQSDLEIVTRGDTEIVHGYDSLDPTYVSKVKILNDALREIGMGKYQVWSAYYGLRYPSVISTNLTVVVSFCCHRVWLAVVRFNFFPTSCITYAFSMPHFDSDNLWPVITYSTITPV